MLENLGNRFQDIFKKIRGHGKLSDSNIKDALREVKMSLLEADVNYKVVKDFTNRISEKAIGTEVIRGVNPAQQFIKLVNDELVELLGGTSSKLTKGLRNPTIIMLAGLQGAGKTTFAANLANLGKLSLKFGVDMIIILVFFFFCNSHILKLIYEFFRLQKSGSDYLFINFVG